MEFSLLADEPDAASTVARWYFDEWCRDTGRHSIEFVIKNVTASLNKVTAPLIVLCKIDGLLVGAAELKTREMETFPDYEFWLGGVYVHKDFRGRGVGAGLLSQVSEFVFTQNHGYFPLEMASWRKVNVSICIT